MCMLSNNPSTYLVAQSYPTLCDPMDCSQPGSSAHGDSPGKNTEESPWTENLNKAIKNKLK